MRNSWITSVFVVLMCMTSIKASAYDIAVANDEGITIYYNYINGGNEVEVTYKSGEGFGYNHPRTSGYEDITEIVIPSIVNYSGKALHVIGVGAHAFDCFSGMGGTTEYNFKLNSISLPDGILYIGDEAFEGCKKLKAIELPSNITKIGISAFHGSGLVSIIIPKSVTELGSEAFGFCSSLKNVVLSESLTEIKQRTFWYSSLESIKFPKSLKSIADYSFSNCEKLTSAIISNSTLNLTEMSFYGCENISKLEYLSDDIGSTGPLFDFSSLGIDTVIVPAKAYPYLTENSEWEKCDRIFARGEDSRLYVGIRNEYNSIVSVNGITNQTLVLVPHDEKAVLQRTYSSPAEMYVMMNGESSVLTGDNPSMMVIPSSYHSLACNIVYAIDRNMSGENDYIVTMTSSGTLLSQIGRNNLEKVKRLKVIGDINGTDILAIRKMTSLEDLDLSQANIVNGGSSYLNEYTTSANEIGEYFFKDITNLIVLHLPESGIQIKRNVFDGCTKLQEVTIPGSFTGIDENAFSNSGIKRVVFAENEKSIYINKTAFSNTSISFLDLNRDYSTSLSNYDDYYIFGNKGALKILTIDGQATKIDDYVFTRCNTLSSLTIGSKVKRIGTANFSNSSSLETVIFKDSENEIELIGAWSTSYTQGFGFFGNSPIKKMYCGRNISNRYGTFMDLTKLTDLAISENVSKVVRGQFKGCIGLYIVTLPNSINSIGDNAFEGCANLSELKMPNQLKNIGDEAFSNCESLNSIEIPSTVTSIGSQAFANCSTLISINIGNNVSSIYSKTFAGCSSLQEVRLGEKITSIGSNAFEGCINIKKLYSWNPTPPTVSSTSLSGINRNVCTLYVPKGSGDIYWLHPEWELFFDIKEVETSNINTIRSDGATNNCYGLDGQRTITPRKGINIIKKSDGTSQKVIVK